MSKDKREYKPQLETPTLARRVVVVENAYFNDQFRKSALDLKKVISKHKVRIKATQQKAGT